MVAQEITKLVTPYFEKIQKGALADSLQYGDTKVSITVSGLLSLCEAKKQTLTDAISVKATALHKEFDSFDIKPDYTDWAASQIPESLKTFKIFDWPFCRWEGENTAAILKQDSNWLKKFPDSYFATSAAQAKERELYNDSVRAYHEMYKDLLSVDALCKVLSTKGDDQKAAVPQAKMLDISIRTLALLG